MNIFETYRQNQRFIYKILLKAVEVFVKRSEVAIQKTIKLFFIIFKYCIINNEINGEGRLK
ncbi:Conserved hypothetical protein [Clostridium neonatale]|nr:Conserved hypothetical protein [Clostridium neonatale]CAH0438118.1 Conserved hypothetical protein [Clostridium neonatale]CAI3196615.1 Conserved hypothetical protein [Clostridium neonatale]CAI3202204.1 Conserved hypothetical protein [Clostridium neonatale]CAI3239358.1 Conserved hypothetical protein [Clostridium neonatale]